MEIQRENDVPVSLCMSKYKPHSLVPRGLENFRSMFRKIAMGTIF